MAFLQYVICVFLQAVALLMPLLALLMGDDFVLHVQQDRFFRYKG